MEIQDGLVKARERAPSRFKRIKNMAIPLALVAALSVSSVPAFAARGSGGGGRATRPAPTNPTQPNNPAPAPGGVITLPSGGTGVFHPARTLGDHTSGGCNEIVTDLVMFGGGIDARILADYLHIAGGQTTRLRASSTQEGMSMPFSRWEGRIAMPASRGQIYGGGRIGQELFCAGGASGTNGALDILDFQNRVNSQSSEADGLEFGTMQSIGGSVQGSTFSYDPILDVWATRDDMPAPRAGSAQRAARNKLYVIGGRVAGSKLVERLNGGQIQTVQVDTVEPCIGESQSEIFEFDPSRSVGNQWRQVGTLSLPRSDAAAVVVQNKILVIGGCRVTLNQASAFPVTRSNVIGPAVSLGGKFTGNADIPYVLRVASVNAGNITAINLSLNGGASFGGAIAPTLDAEGNPTNTFALGAGMTATFGTSGSALVGDTYSFTAKGATVEFLKNIDVFDPTQPQDLLRSATQLPSARANAAAAARGKEVHVLGGWRLEANRVGAIGTAANGGEQDALIDTAAGETNHVVFDVSSLDPRQISLRNMRSGPRLPGCNNSRALGSGSNRVELTAGILNNNTNPMLIVAGGNCRSLQGFNRIAAVPGDPVNLIPGNPPRPAASVNRDDIANTDTLALTR